MNDEIKTGTIKLRILDKKYGFITEDSGQDIFFHKNGVVDPGFDDLRKGMVVNYLIKSTGKGPEAISIVAIPNKD